MQREATSRKAADDRRRRITRDEHGRKWSRATAVRERWTERDFAEEALRLEAEIAARLADGRVTRVSPGYATGANKLEADSEGLEA